MFEEFSVELEASPGACMSFVKDKKTYLTVFERKKLSLSKLKP
jgi:hypothetical protein